MVRSESLTRRRVASILVAGSVGALAGCSGTGDDADDDAETSDDTDGSDGSDETDLDLREEETDLVVHLENEDGDPVSSENATVEFRDHETDITYTIEKEIEDGVAEPKFTEPTTYTVTILSEEYENAEREITLEAGDEEELSFELESAS